MSKYVLALDASQLNAYSKCNLMWAYGYREYLALTGASSEALDKGTLMHLLLEIFYKKRAGVSSFVPPLQTMAETIEWFKVMPQLEESQLDRETLQFLINRFMQYVGYWENRDLTPLLNEDNEPAVELGFSKIIFESNEVLFIVEGKIDVLHIDQNSKEIVIVDHKTQSRINNLYDFRPQALTYAWAAQRNYFMYNYIGMQKDFKEGVTFRRNVVNIPTWMIQRWEREMLRIFWQIHDHELSTYQHDGNEVLFAKNFSNCAGAFDSNPCQYHWLCESQNPEMREQLKKFKYELTEPWEPWKNTEVKLK